MNDEKPFEVIDSKQVFEGQVCSVVVETLRLSGGKEIKRELVRQAPAVVIVPCLNKDTLLLIKQFRHAASAYIWEFPAGRANENEQPRECAIRELEEETGYKAREMEQAISFFTSPGISNEWMHLFVASSLEKSKTNFDEDEFIETKSFPVSAVEEMIKDGGIRDAKTILSFFYWLKTESRT